MSQRQKQRADRGKETAPKTRHPVPVNQGPEALPEGPDLLALQCAIADPAMASAAGIVALQETAGNRAVQRFVVQRQAPEEEEELQLKAAQRQPPEEEEALMMKPIQRVGPEGGPVPSDVESAISRARGGGQPLESGLRAQMGETMGYDFGEVRVHTGPESGELNQRLTARAFTTGSDIFFRQGEYNPGSSEGRELISHELTHVVQQNSGRVSGAGGGMTVRPAGDAFENEANSRAKRVIDRRGYGSQVVQRATYAQVKPRSVSDDDVDVILRELGLANLAPADVTADLLFRSLRTYGMVKWTYESGQSGLGGALQNQQFNCESIGELLLVLYLRKHGEAPVGNPRVSHNPLLYRCGTKPFGLRMAPNVRGREEVVFSGGHMVASIAGTKYDVIAGLSGAEVDAAYEEGRKLGVGVYLFGKYMYSETGERSGGLSQMTRNVADKARSRLGL